MFETTIQSLSFLAQSGGDTGFAIGGGIFACGFGLVSLALFVFWVWMLIDCLLRDFEGLEKIIWLLVIFFFPLIGALLYLFIGRARGTKG